MCTNAILNGLMNVHAWHMGLSFDQDNLHMDAIVSDGIARQQILNDAEKLDIPINYGGMKLGAGGEAVQVAALDKLNLTNVTFMKFDVQGSEKLAIYGARETIRRNHPVIAWENDPGFTDVDIALPTSVRDFDVMQYLSSEGYILAPGYTLQSYNIIALPPKKGRA